MAPTRGRPEGEVDVAILGAGPIGLEAAARARETGARTVVLERDGVAAAVRRWGSVRMFSPFSLNAGPAGLRVLGEAAADLPGGDEILTGDGFRDAYLVPLGERLADGVDLRLDATVTGVTRAGWLKGDAIGAAERSAEPFRILYERAGEEAELRARVVLDCTGTYGQPAWAGPGGLPARGERALRGTLAYHLPDLERDRDRFGRRRTLLIGAGHSAATAAVWLADLARTAGARFLWSTRREADRPLAPITDDPLPERDALVRRANAIALDPTAGGEWVGGSRLLSVRRGAAGLEVELEAGGAVRAERFDRILSLVGYEPDDDLYRQLQVHECYASRAPMKLAAALLAASTEGPADCLTGGGLGAATLTNPEPDFFILGMKSHGKASAFLLRTGYEQVEDAFSLLAGPWARWRGRPRSPARGRG